MMKEAPRVLQTERFGYFGNRLALILSLVLLAAPAAAAEKWYIEFNDPSLDESVMRRAVALELREVEIPGDPRREGDAPEKVSLRVLIVKEGDSIEVSLWDRGEFVGRRRVSSNTHPRVLARRVGLAVGELGRQLSARRSRLIQMMQREEFLAEERKAEARRLSRLRSMGVRVDAHALALPQGAYLAGPSVGVELNREFPFRLALGASWMAGALPALSAPAAGTMGPVWSTFDFWLNADYVLELEDRSWMTLGALAAHSAVRVGGETIVDEIAFQRDTYTIRAGVRLGYNYEIRSGIRLRGEIDGGSLLRTIPLRYDTTRVDLGGPYVGVNLGITLASYSSTN
jgi:hypothetical protein